MITPLKKFAKDLLFHTPARNAIFPRYPYNFRANQLCFLCECLERTRSVEGAIAEIGCSLGWTSIFLNNYMRAQGIAKEYIAVDTFSGFVKEDVAVEVNERAKQPHFFNAFQTNKKKWYDGSMTQSGFMNVRSIQADVNEFDLLSLAPLSFVLLDVDLYRPMKKALPELYSALSINGIIVVDDCDPEEVQWDGSDQAYKEFASEMGFTPEYQFKKLGVIRKVA